MRTDGRTPDQMRPVKITRDYIPHAEGSVLIELGRTRVICTVTYEGKAPRFLAGTQRGWVTAEYSMLPRSTGIRSKREATSGRQGGRTMEIQRLIGRSLRAVTDASVFPDSTFWVDCDVIEADGGTRTAAITGAYVALRDAFDTMVDEGVIAKSGVIGNIAAISIGVVAGAPCLDLCFEEDVHADVDLNLVATERGEIIEIQGTSERRPLARADLDTILDLGLSGVRELIAYQDIVLSEKRPGV
ncbi:MAG: ribonuclease PH [Candidatus Anoxymicrobium japonicum]|uniref:Ribonuclease PH n=1 Tax=Candidatus Anoxymicrobium japonicum TaxID=2013648 RepID=A0A2N3G8D0_9ACTN|nr:MAG: ribonuclease PH [Candidatus Anoxymicrobium japonicum]